MPFADLIDRDDPPESRQLNLRNALVIEGADAFRSGIVQLLRKEGWIVHEVRRAEQARPLLAQIPYHLIVIGLEPSGEAGMGFARTLRASTEWRTIPLVIIASSSTRAFATQAAEFDAFLALKSTWEEDLSSILALLRDPQ
jgi:DNA-binding response OmpR family regulator